MTRYQFAWSSPDPSATALDTLRVSGLFYCRSELTAPWGLLLPPADACLWFHAIKSGRCQLLQTGKSALALSAGDVVLLTRGQNHRLRSTGSSASTPNVLDLPQEMMGERASQLRHGGGGAATVLICGVLRLDPFAARTLVPRLPPIIRVTENKDSYPSLQPLLELVEMEAFDKRFGTHSVTARLADIIVIHVLRGWLGAHPTRAAAWLAAGADSRIGRALTLLHDCPAANWTVASLAQAVAMSRAAFAARFALLVGESPMRYALRLRMRLAGDLLGDGHTTSQVALQCGYNSSAAFSRAYKRIVGGLPTATEMRT